MVVDLVAGAFFLDCCYCCGEEEAGAAHCGMMMGSPQCFLLYAFACARWNQGSIPAIVSGRVPAQLCALMSTSVS